LKEDCKNLKTAIRIIKEIWKYNIRMGLRETGFEDVNWITAIHDRGQ